MENAICQTKHILHYMDKLYRKTNRKKDREAFPIKVLTLIFFHKFEYYWLPVEAMLKGF